MFFKNKGDKPKSAAPLGEAGNGKVGLAAGIPDIGAKPVPGSSLKSSGSEETNREDKPAEVIVSQGGYADQLPRQAQQSKQISAAIGDCIRVFMRAPSHRHLSLAELEPLVVPAVMTQQFAIAEMRPDNHGATQPVGVVIWASVSAEVDARLASTLDQPIKLEPSDWRSGDIIWLLEATGDTRIVGDLLGRLSHTRLEGKAVKTRTRGSDGKMIVALLSGNEVSG